MADSVETGGAMTRRALGVIRRLPLPLQGFIFYAAERFALFLVVILVLPILVVVAIASSVVFGGLSWVLGWPTGALGAIIAYAWLASWIILPIIITVRLWRSIPVLIRLRRIASDGLEVDQLTASGDATPAADPGPDPAPLPQRLADLDARLAAPPPTDEPD